MPREQPAELHGASVNEWINVVRRARLGRTTKLVALMLATYANADGSKVYPGVGRLVVQCEIRYSSARAALADLRQAGLIERVRQGNRRRGQADEYRLTFSADLLDRIVVPTPTEERAAIDREQEQNAAAAAVRQRRRGALLRQSAGVEQDDDLRQPTGVGEIPSTPAMHGVDAAIYASGLELSTPATDPPPSIAPLQEGDPPSTVVALGAQPQDAREAPHPYPASDTPPVSTDPPCRTCARIAGRTGVAIACSHREAG